MRLIGGFDVTDTVFAELADALVVEVHDSSGAVVPPGTIVRFTAAINGGIPEMLMRAAADASTSGYSELATAETDAAGRAGVLVKLGAVAGPARISVAAPTIARWLRVRLSRFACV